MGKSTIEWTHYTFNPWIGCAHVSPGCEHCYAETFTGRGMWRSLKGWRLVGDGQLWGAKGARLFAPDAYWDRLDDWDRLAHMAGERRRVFVASMADVLEEHPSRAVSRAMYIARGRLADAVHRCANLDFLIVTKRPENWRLLRNHLLAWHGITAATQRNLWLIVSAEDQRRADERIPLLLRAAGVAVRGVSYEPALGPVDFDALHASQRCEVCGKWPLASAFTASEACDCHPESEPVDWHGGIDWVIAGSESGHGARPCDLDWIRAARDQCVAAGVPFFLKQLPRDLIPTADLAEHDKRKRKVGLPKLDGRQWAQVPCIEEIAA